MAQVGSRRLGRVPEVWHQKAGEKANDDPAACLNSPCSGAGTLLIEIALAVQE